MTPDQFRVITVDVDDARPYADRGAYLIHGEDVLLLVGHSQIADSGTTSGYTGIRYQLVARELLGENQRIDYLPGASVQLLVPRTVPSADE